jgi:hypothetical protein
LFTALKSVYIFLLTLAAWVVTDGVQGQAARWQSAFEEKAFAQPADSSDDALACLLAADASVNDSVFAQTHAELSGFCQQLVKKRKKFLSEPQFLYYVFRQTRQRYLHHYQPYPLFTALLRDSVYNCVSGTALYAWVLNRLGFHTEIRETNCHAYLRVKTTRSEYLIDATDPYNGFVSDDEMLIVRRELWYASNELRSGKPLNQAITLTQLAGLQYFNEAVKAFNRRSFEKCLVFLEKAEFLYNGSAKVASLRQMTESQLSPSLVASGAKAGR